MRNYLRIKIVDNGCSCSHCSLITLACISKEKKLSTVVSETEAETKNIQLEEKSPVARKCLAEIGWLYEILNNFRICATLVTSLDNKEAVLWNE